MTARLPTTDIYFTHACGDWLGRWWSHGPVTALGRNTFVAGKTMLLFRRDDDTLMRRALDWRGRLVYLIDDDVTGAAESPDLPPDYRRRLAAFDATFHQRLLERADTILVPSAPLASILGENPDVTTRIREIFPYWRLPLADTAHFDGLAAGAPLRIAHLGSGSHAGAFDAIAPAIADVLATHPAVHFTYVGARPHPNLPDDHPRIERIGVKRWPAYRRWLGLQRFHLALYPLDATRFDRARSPNKLVEHAIVGAVGLYPDDWPPRSLTDGGHLTAPTDPADWAGAIAAAVEQRTTLARLTEQSRRAIARRNDPAIQRALWSEVLDLVVA